MKSESPSTSIVVPAPKMPPTATAALPKDGYAVRLFMWFLDTFFPVPPDAVGDRWRQLADAKIARKIARSHHR
jgi:hypothetical protein